MKHSTFIQMKAVWPMPTPYAKGFCIVSGFCVHNDVIVFLWLLLTERLNDANILKTLCDFIKIKLFSRVGSHDQLSYLKAV